MMKRFLTLKEAADYLGITEGEMNNLSNAHQVTAYKIGGIYTRFKVDELEAYRRKGVIKDGKNNRNNILENAVDFFYFNDFYIYSIVAILFILYFIFK